MLRNVLCSEGYEYLCLCDAIYLLDHCGTFTQVFKTFDPVSNCHTNTFSKVEAIFMKLYYVTVTRWVPWYCIF